VENSSENSPPSPPPSLPEDLVFAYAGNKDYNYCWRKKLKGANKKWSTAAYVQIFKSGTAEICGQKQMHGHPPHPNDPVEKAPFCKLGNNVLHQRQVFTFSFVRDPLSHFVSGYSEVVSRSMGNFRSSADKCMHRGCFRWLREEDPLDRAKAFVADYVQGRATNHACCEFLTALHVVPQAAFLRSALGGRFGCRVRKIDFIGRLENMTSDWARMNEVVGSSDGATFGNYKQQSKNHGHPKTNAASGNKWRVAMDRLLQDDSQLSASTRDMLCTILNVDNVCFGYPRRKVCAHANVGNAACPFVVP
jgi:hypothetical protein